MIENIKSKLNQINGSTRIVQSTSTGIDRTYLTVWTSISELLNDYNRNNDYSMMDDSGCGVWGN